MLGFSDDVAWIDAGHASDTPKIAAASELTGV
jgi:hypothetical protein